MSIQLLLWRQWFLGVSKELARKPVNFVPLLCFIQVCTESLIPAAEKEIRGLRVSSWFSCCCWIPGRIFKFYSKMYLEPCYLKNKKQTNQKAIWKPFISFIFPFVFLSHLLMTICTLLQSPCSLPYQLDYSTEEKQKRELQRECELWLPLVYLLITSLFTFILTKLI